MADDRKIAPANTKTKKAAAKKAVAKKAASKKAVTKKKVAATKKVATKKAPAPRPAPAASARPTSPQPRPVHEPQAALSPSKRTAAVSPEQRAAMIEEAAYYKAEKRNFAPGFETEDWDEAEREVDERIKKS